MNDLTDERILETKVFLRPDETARVLQVSKRTVYNLYYDGTLEGTKLRGCLRITTESIRRLLEEARL